MDLKQKFINIRNNLDENEKTFAYFDLRAPIDEIPGNVFIDIRLECITMSESNFTRIHSNAFNSTCLYGKIHSDFSSAPKLSNLSPDYNFNISQIYLIEIVI